MKKSKRALVKCKLYTKQEATKSQLGAEAVANLDVLDSLVNHLVHDDLCGQALVDDGGGLAHEERSRVVHHVVVEVVTLALNVMLDGDLAASR